MNAGNLNTIDQTATTKTTEELQQLAVEKDELNRKLQGYARDIQAYFEAKKVYLDAGQKLRLGRDEFLRNAVRKNNGEMPRGQIVLVNESNGEAYSIEIVDMETINTDSIQIITVV